MRLNLEVREGGEVKPMTLDLRGACHHCGLSPFVPPGMFYSFEGKDSPLLLYRCGACDGMTHARFSGDFLAQRVSIDVYMGAISMDELKPIEFSIRFGERYE